MNNTKFSTFRQFLASFLFLTAGAVLAAFALEEFLVPATILDGGIVGVSFGEDCQDPDYPYAIAAQYNGEPVAEADLQVQTIPAHTYVVFPCKGKMPQALQTLYQKICSEFFPNSEYQPANGPDFEVYPSADVDSPNFRCEIWVAAERK